MSGREYCRLAGKMPATPDAGKTPALPILQTTIYNKAGTGGAAMIVQASPVVSREKEILLLCVSVSLC